MGKRIRAAVASVGLALAGLNVSSCIERDEPPIFEYTPKQKETIKKEIKPKVSTRKEIPPIPLVPIYVQQTFVVLINNDSEEDRHITNLRRAYRTLRSKNVDPCNIYVVSDPNENIECKKPINVNQPSTSHGVKSAFSDLEKRVHNQDTLVVYTTGHGDPDVIPFGKTDKLSYKDLRKLTDSLKPRLTIAISDLCFGGGIVDSFKDSKGKVIALSPAHDQPVVCNFFTPYFWDSIRYNGFDADHNGSTSLREAFFRAMALSSVELANANSLSDEKVKEFTEVILPKYASNFARIDDLFFARGINDFTFDKTAKKLNLEAKIPTKLVHVKSQNFEKEVITYSRDVAPVFVAYGDPSYCNPCFKLEEAINKELLQEFRNKVKFVDMNSSEESDKFYRIIRRYSPRAEMGSIPHMFFVKNGRIVSDEIGFHSSEDVSQQIRRYLLN